ncbi:hypothetical protein G6F32_015972 [Rhizopus arrhizus]|nr:hypothetical protein G6F32_015972 [Rhizopus arrhizus]
MGGGRRVRRQGPRRPFGGVHQHFQRAGFTIQADHVALADLRQRATARRFRRHVDGRRNLARGAGQAAVGDQRHAPALVLQPAQQRRQRMQFRHAVRTRALVTHHRHEMLGQQTAGVQLVQHLRRIDHHRRCLDAAVLRLHRRQLDQ